MTITQTIDIPDNHRLHLDLEIPREIPTGRARIEFKVVHFPKKDEKPEKPITIDSDGKIHITKKQLEEIGKDCPITQSLVGILHTDKTIDEIRTERLAKHL